MTTPSRRAFLFDLDGTLVETVGIRIEAWMEVFRRFGIEAEHDFVGSLMGSDGKHVAREVASRAGRTLEPGQDAEIDRLAGERFGELNHDPRALPGASDILAFLDRAGVPWAIATSSRPEEATASVDALELGRRPIVADGGDVEHAKPAPDLLLKASRDLGVDPTGTWYVGDSTWDMQAAVAAGMVAVGVATGATSETDLSEAGAHVTYPTLHALLDELSSRA